MAGSWCRRLGGVDLGCRLPQKPEAQAPAASAANTARSIPRSPQTGGLPPVRDEEKPSEPPANVVTVMQHSRAITRKSASNLALAFMLLPRAKRDAMSALYAFCREVDDVADDESVPVEERREQLAAWRADVRRACDEETPQFPVNRELQPVIRQYPPALRAVRRTDQGLRNGFGHQAL